MSSSSEFLIRFREAGQSIIATRRPWGQLLDLSALSLPSSVSDAISRITQNASYFFFNYFLVLLFVLFLSLIYHPVSMIIFLVVSVGWYLLYFSREDPLFVFGLQVDEKAVVGGLGVLTIVALLFTNVWLNVFLSLVIGALLVCLHAAFRGCEDLAMDDQESPYGAMLSEGERGGYTAV